MSLPFSATDLLYQLLPWLPYWLVCLAGMVACALYWKGCPRVAALVLIALAITFIAVVAQPITLLFFIKSRPMGASDTRMMLVIMSFTFTLIRAVGFALLIAAAFMARPRPFAGDTPLVPPTTIR